MASGTTSLPVRSSFGQTSRTDAWWLQPLVVAVFLLLAVIYLTWGAIQGEFYTFGNYLSPLYSPELFGDTPHALFGPRPGIWPSWLPWSPAFLILWAPGGFRVTCYYYRGAGYKALWLDPPNCAVGEPRGTYLGERSLPLILMNVHRFFLYFALLFVVILTYDSWRALWFLDPVTGQETFGLGVGTLVIALNAFLLGAYTLSCHSLRHLVGGGLDVLFDKPVRRTALACVGCLNKRHMLFAWMSLVWVCFTDLYVRMLSMGIWTDWRIF
ncbi:MAG TPA: succinate dehydrogenase [Gemmatimonadetes bacterium]|nr:succinate dehydrogenase [Gemmatimonadota bacterium]